MLEIFFQKAPFTNRLLVSLILFIFLVLLLFSFRNPFFLRNVTYNFVREIAKKNIELKTLGWNKLEGEHFIIKYTDRDLENSQMILEVSEEAFEPVNKLLRYTHKKPILVVVYPDKKELSKSFGWDADESAMGVYWAGVIRILSPSAWIENADEIEKDFKKNGPMVHEYAHLVVDYKTRGNYPRWFTEGIAQFVEKEITGYQFASLGATENWYSLSDLNSGYDTLPNQSLVYGQSLLMVEFLVDSYGFEKILNLLDRLGEGKSMETAFNEELGITLEEFEESFPQWVLLKEMN